jgi:hypothetical protein
MMVAIAAGIVGRWSHNEKAVPSAKAVIEIMFALILIAALDHGRTQSIARGFALLFLVSVLLSNNSPLTGLAQSTKGATANTAGNVLETASQSAVTAVKK